jgi:hypothetical protein
MGSSVLPPATALSLQWLFQQPMSHVLNNRSQAVIADALAVHTGHILA